MTRLTYRAVNVAQKLAQDWQLGANTNSVKISIYDLDDDALDINQAAMTNETRGLFCYDWTPSQEHTYRVDYYNETLDSHEFEIVEIISEVTNVG